MTIGFSLQDDVTIWLYDALDNRSMVLSNVGELYIDTQFQGVEELHFQLPAEDPRALYLIADGMIEYPEGRFWINSNFDDTNPQPVRTVKAKPLWDKLTWRSKPGIFTIENKTPLEGLELILDGSGWSAGTVTTNSATYTYEAIDATNLELLRSWATITKSELTFDTAAKTVSLTNASGAEKNLGFFYGSNLDRITRTFIPPQVTRLYPYGANDLDITEVNPTGTAYIENYSWYMTTYGLTENQARARFQKDWAWQDTRFLLPLPLMEAAQTYLTELSKPQISYKGRVVDLSRLTTVTADAVVPGDWVALYDEVLGYSNKTRITRYIDYPVEPSRNVVELELFNKGTTNVLDQSRTIDYDKMRILVDQNELGLTITSTQQNVNQMIITSVGEASLAASGHIIGEATGSGVLAIEFKINGTDYIEVRQIPFTNGEQVEFTFVSFASGLDVGSYQLDWRYYISSGTGTIAVNARAARAVLWISGALGTTGAGVPSQFWGDDIDPIETQPLGFGESWLVEFDVQAPVIEAEITESVSAFGSTTVTETWSPPDITTP